MSTVFHSFYLFVCLLSIPSVAWSQVSTTLWDQDANCPASSTNQFTNVFPTDACLYFPASGSIPASSSIYSCTGTTQVTVTLYSDAYCQTQQYSPVVYNIGQCNSYSSGTVSISSVYTSCTPHGGTVPPYLSTPPLQTTTTTPNTNTGTTTTPFSFTSSTSSSASTSTSSTTSHAIVPASSDSAAVLAVEIAAPICGTLLIALIVVVVFFCTRNRRLSSLSRDKLAALNTHSSINVPDSTTVAIASEGLQLGKLTGAEEGKVGNTVVTPPTPSLAPLVPVFEQPKMPIPQAVVSQPAAVQTQSPVEMAMPGAVPQSSSQMIFVVPDINMVGGEQPGMVVAMRI